VVRREAPDRLGHGELLTSRRASPPSCRIIRPLTSLAARFFPEQCAAFAQVRIPEKMTGDPLLGSAFKFGEESYARTVMTQPDKMSTSADLFRPCSACFQYLIIARKHLLMAGRPFITLEPPQYSR
jgi:hypothetical protein